MLELVLFLIALCVIISHPVLLLIAFILWLVFGIIKFALKAWTNGFKIGFITAIILLAIIGFFF